MREDAVLKLRGEMQGAGQHIVVIGEYLIELVSKDADAAEKIMCTEKTIDGSFKVMKEEATKIRIGNCACLTSEEGFAIVRKYFEIKDLKFGSTEQPLINQFEKRVEIDLDSLI